MADLPSQKKHNGSRLRQYAAAIVVNIASVMNGTGIGWMSPVMPFLQSDKNPLAGSPMSDSTASWVGSAGSVGALVSAPVYAIVCRYCSRKIVGYVVGFFGLLSWSLILFAQSELMLLFGRAFLVNIASIVDGMNIGWTSPVLPLLQSNSNPVGGSPMSDMAASWLGSILSAGALVSTPMYWLVSKHYSRKIVGYVVGLFALIGWALVLFAQSELMLLFGRLFLGFVGYGNNILCSIYIAETVDDDIRGALGTFMSMFISGGIVISYILGSYLPYTTFNIICLAIPIVYLVAFWWMPESPVYLETKGQHIEAQKVRELLNMKSYNPNPDQAVVDSNTEVNTANTTFLSEVIHNIGTRKALIIGLGVMACNQLSGVMAVVSYTVTIFQESGSKLSPNISTILVGTLQVIGVYLTSFLVDRLGRKILLVTSSIITATCLGSLSLYFYLKSQKFDVSSVEWVPVTALCVYMIGFSIGVGSIPFIVIGEIFSPQVKSKAITLCVSMGNLTSFLVAMFFLSLTKALGLSGCYLLFAMCCLSSAAFCYFIVPETKNKSLETILKELNPEVRTNKIAEE